MRSFLSSIPTFLIVGYGVAAVAAMSAVFAVAASPFTMMDAVVLLSIGLTVIILMPIIMMIVNRQRAFPMAHAILEEQRHLGLAIRTKNYDLYLPNKDKICIGDKQGEPQEREPTQALLLLPGALVEHTAYAGLASRLADRHGILVAVINLEPTRLAYSFLPTIAPSRLLRLAQEIEQRVQAQESSRTNGTDKTTKLLWSIGGHSLGAYAALQLFPNLQTNHGWKKLICLGAGIHTNNMTEKIQSSPQSKSPEVSPFLLTPANTLLVQASNDGFRRFYNDQDLISVVTVAKVQGGNHAGVAYYGPQTFPIRDGQRDISLETQQDLTAVAIAEFLRNRQ